MAFSVRTDSFVKTGDAAPASQVITGVGFQPKALILWTEGSPSVADTFNISTRRAVGFSSSTTDEKSLSVASQDAIATSNTSRRMANKALTIVEWAEVTIAECDLTSFDSDGFTLSWSTNNATGYIIHYMALGGDDLTNAAVLDWTQRTTTGNQAVTGVGFQPDAVIHIDAGSITAASPTTAANFAVMLGAMTTTDQWVNASSSIDSAGTSDTQRGQLTDANILHISSTLTITARASFVSMDSDGFTVNFSVVTGTANRVFSLCLKGGQYDVGTFNKSTSGAPASQAVTGLAFQPTGFLLSSAQNTTSATVVAQARQGVGASDGTREQAAAFHDQDAQAVAQVVDSIDSTTKAFVKVDNATPVIDAEADITSLDSGGFTLSWSTNDAVATEMLYFAVGSSTAAPAATPLRMMTGIGT